jgi:protease-4
MKQFFKIMFASTLGVILASMVMIFGGICLFVGVLASSESVVFKPEDNSVLIISLSGEISDQVSKDPISEILGETSDDLGLSDLVKAIRLAKNNDKIKGIYLETGDLSAGFATLQALRNELADFKTSGKFIAAYSDAYTQKAYYVASIADSIFMNPLGTVGLVGLASQGVFYAGLEEKLGVEVEIFKVGTYKSAVEPFILKKFSEPNREQITSFLGSIWSNVTESIEESRGVSSEKLNEYINSGYAIGDGESAIEYNLTDALYYRNQAEDAVARMVGAEKDGEPNLKTVSLSKALTMKDKKDSCDDKIAILYAEGEISEESSSSLSPISDEKIISYNTVKELRKLQKDEDVKAVVFRVNSPGGSAFVSEQIWKAVQDLKEVKPVVVSMGDYAASGGYYISCGADKIFAEPTTLTGSIGVFGMFYNAQGLLDKIGVTTDVVKTDKFSDIGDISRPMDESEKALIQHSVEMTYKLFLERCAEGRGKTTAEIDSIGQGRVWSGEQALSLGLVDALGGIDDAVKEAASLAEINKYEITVSDVQKDFWSKLLDDKLNDVRSGIIRKAIGDEYEIVRMANKMKANKGIMARMPYIIL